MSSFTCLNCGHLTSIFGRDGAAKIAKDMDVLLTMAALNRTLNVALETSLNFPTEFMKTALSCLGCIWHSDTGHLAHGLRRAQLRRGVAALCIGGGMGIAICVERYFGQTLVIT